VAIGLLATNLVAVHAVAVQRVALARSDITPGLDQSVRLHHRAASLPLYIAISLGLRNEATLDRFITGVSDPTSRRFGQYLTPNEFAALYAPTPPQVDEVVAHLRSNGLAVTSISSNRTIIDATGSVGAVEQAFGVTISDWHDVPENRDFYGNENQPTLPTPSRPWSSESRGSTTTIERCTIPWHRHVHPPRPSPAPITRRTLRPPTT
jgi:kumamolisin